MYQLFIFFMITDPKTTVRSKKGQCVVVFLVALVEMVMRHVPDRVRAVLCAVHRGADGHADRDVAGFATCESEIAVAR